MPIIKSAKKRVKVATKANLRNVKTKRALRESLKAFSAALASGSAAQITKAENEAMSAIDMAAKKAVIHKNKAARKKAQLAAQAKAKGVKIAKSSKPKAKSQSPAKRAPAKTAAKKTAAKKAGSKK